MSGYLSAVIDPDDLRERTRIAEDLADCARTGAPGRRQGAVARRDRGPQCAG
ncbi:hypothetical protein [Gordonia oryzae]|uniref:hypothetical protein n=1 Tax=Gordonia oryzae TaxID=2487349 RepID=UPI00161A48F9|nr:hypothetical protein [Gordonia oryzae]